MPEQDALNFIVHVRRSPDLRKRVDALKGAAAVRDLAALAEKEGFYFTEQEYRAAVVTLSRGELSDEALDALIREMGSEHR